MTLPPGSAAGLPTGRRGHSPSSSDDRTARTGSRITGRSRDEPRGGDTIQALSAGLEPTMLHPVIVDVMHERGLDVSHQTAKPLTRVFSRGVDVVVTLCGEAHEYASVLPRGVRRIHWPVDDPIDPRAGGGDVRTRFRRTRDRLELLTRTLVAELREQRARHPRPARRLMDGMRSFLAMTA